MLRSKWTNDDINSEAYLKNKRANRNTQVSFLLIVPEPPFRDTNRHDDADDHLGKKNEEKDKKVEGAVTPRRRKKDNRENVLESVSLSVLCRLLFFFYKDNGSNLKALYTGRNQQTKEQGVKRSAQRMARPRPTPLPEGSTQNMAREENTLKSSVAAQTEQSRRVEKRGFSTASRTAAVAALFHTHALQRPLPYKLGLG